MTVTGLIDVRPAGSLTPTRFDQKVSFYLGGQNGQLLLCPNGNQNHYQRRTYVCLQKQRSKSRHPTYVLKLITQVMTTNLKPAS